MKRPFSGLAAVVLVAGVLAGLLVWSGCDEGTGRSLTVEPATVTLGGTTNAVIFAVASNSLRELSLPIVWEVANPALGNIAVSEGASARYVGTALRGINVVTARDQYGAEGFATVNQQ